MLCFVGFRIFCLVCYKLYSTDRYSYITAPQLLFYLQHWTRLTNIQTNTQARLEFTKQGHAYMLKQNFPSQTYRKWFIKLCACGPDFAAWNEWPAMVYNTQFIFVRMNGLESTSMIKISLCKNVEFWCGASRSTKKYQHTINCVA